MRRLVDVSREVVHIYSQRQSQTAKVRTFALCGTGAGTDAGGKQTCTVD
jgi:hypothetical protein